MTSGKKPTGFPALTPGIASGLKAVLAPKSNESEDDDLDARLKIAGKILTDTQIRLAKPSVPVAEKVVKDSYTVPESDYKIVDDTIFRAAGMRQRLTKSDVVRLGFKALAALDDEALGNLIAGLQKIKRGPKVR